MNISETQDQKLIVFGGIVMADVKKILVVDDHFEMLELLRSMLESSGQDYEVLAVPSAEEGLLELRSAHFDLLITDVRLPGMSGFDLIRRARAVKPDMPVLMITAYSSEQGKKEAVDLGVFRYFEKPLDTDEVLAAVYASMFGEGEMIAAPGAAVPREIDVHLPRSASRRLDTLRTDTGASGLALVAGNGQILHQVGGQSGLNLAQLSAFAAKIMRDSFGMADELGSDNPVTIQYHGGDAIELYLANVGRDYFLALWFDVKSKRGRMGTIWVFAQRAIRDLLGILPELGLEPAALPVMETAVPANEPEPTMIPADVIPAPVKPEPELVEFDPAAVAEALGLDESALLESETDVDTFWDTAVTDSQIVTGDGISFAEAQQQGLLESEPATDEPLPEELQELAALAEAETDVDVDDFWDTAVTGEGGGSHSGLTFEEAQKQGLISSKMENEE